MARRDAMENPKIGRLARALQVDWFTAWGLATALWHWSTKFAQDGELTTVKVEDFCDRVRYTSDPAGLSAALAEVGLLDPTGGGWLIHDWPEHCEDSVHMALARKGAYFADGSKPKTNRLSVKEKEDAEALYAQKNAQETHTVQPDAESVRTESAQEAHSVRTSHSLSPCLSQENDTTCNSPTTTAIAAVEPSPTENEPYRSVHAVLLTANQQLKVDPPEPADGEVRRYLAKSSPIRKLLEQYQSPAKVAGLYLFFVQNRKYGDKSWAALASQHAAVYGELMASRKPSSSLDRATEKHRLLNGEGAAA